jgi:hypothetical protein
MRKILLAIASLSILTACGGPEKDMEKALNALYEDMPVCKTYSGSRGRDVEFPIDIKSYFGDPSDDPILKGLEKIGMIEMDKREVRSSTHLTIELTPKGERAGVWNAEESGFCIGTRQVHEIESFMYGDNGQNENVARVEYTWVLGQTPKWFDKKAFSAVPGVGSPEKDVSPMQKNSKGWKAFLF